MQELVHCHINSLIEIAKSTYEKFTHEKALVIAQRLNRRSFNQVGDMKIETKRPNFSIQKPEDIPPQTESVQR
jgi:hypothetical protein